MILTYSGCVTTICVGKPPHYCYRQKPVACLAPSCDLNESWLINWTLRTHFDDIWIETQQVSYKNLWKCRLQNSASLALQILHVDENLGVKAWLEFCWYMPQLHYYDDVMKWKQYPRYWSFCGKFTSHRWILRTKANDAELCCFVWFVSWINGWVINREAGDLRRHRSPFDVIVMWFGPFVSELFVFICISNESHQPIAL